MNYSEFNEIIVKQPYKLNSLFIMKTIARDVGQSPLLSDYFTKTDKGYRIYTNRNISQLVLLLVLPLLWIILVGTYSEIVVKQGVLDIIQKPEMSSVRNVIGSLTILFLIGVIMLVSYISETWIDPATKSIITRTGFPFLSGIKKHERSSLKSILLESIIHKQDFYVIPTWALAFEMIDGRKVQITTRFLSSQSGKTICNDYWANLIYFPERAWVLSRIMDIPLHLLSRDTDINITRETDIHDFSTEEIERINKQCHEKRRAGGIWEAKMRLGFLALLIFVFALLHILGIFNLFE